MMTPQHSILCTPEAANQSPVIEPGWKAFYMRTQIQTPAGYDTLVQLIQIFQMKDNNEASLEEIFSTFEEKNQEALNESDQSNIMNVLAQYSSSTIACPDNEEQVLCVFQDLGDGRYALTADEETCKALLQADDSMVQEEDIPFHVNNREMEENLLKQEKAMKQAEEEDSEDESMRAPSAMERENARGSDVLETSSFMQTAVDEDFNSDGMKMPETYGDDRYDAADELDQDPDVCMAATSEGMLYAMEDQERQRSFEDQERQNAFDDSRYEQAAQNETAALNAAADPENFSEQIDLEESDFYDEDSEDTDAQSDGVALVGKEYHAGTEPFKNSQKPDEHRIDSLESQLDLANRELVHAYDRADAAESRADRWEQKARDSQDDLEAMRQDVKDTGAQKKAMRKIQKAQDRIQQQERKISDHEQQIKENSTGMMKALHRSQIRHDQKAIDRKNRKIASLVEDMQDQDLLDRPQMNWAEEQEVSFYQ